MFTGIIEAIGLVKEVIPRGSARECWIESGLSSGFKIDQSVAHDGVCLTIEEINGNSHRVTVIEETMQKTNLGRWKAGTRINLEQSLRLNARVDGHLVQGHVDTTGVCIKKKEKKNSRELEISFPPKMAGLIVEKGSICINGISLTLFNAGKRKFKVAIIPYTQEYTNIGEVEEGDLVNLEFDLVGKYLLRFAQLKSANHLL